MFQLAEKQRGCRTVEVIFCVRCFLALPTLLTFGFDLATRRDSEKTPPPTIITHSNQHIVIVCVRVIWFLAL